MSIKRLSAEISELKKLFISQYEPAYKLFILGVKDTPTEDDIEAYRSSHPHTRVITLIRKSCRKEEL